MILVAGMHRSGTSALTRVLNLLGAALPGDLIPANDSNPLGHWESAAVCRLNDEILASVGSHWADWRGIEPSWFASPAAATWRDRATALLDDLLGGDTLAVLKDPRFCRLLPLWLEALRAGGATPLVVLPLRNPLEVAASLGRRDRFQHDQAILMWLRHVLDAERQSRGVARCVVAYSRLLTDWPGLVRVLAGRLGIELSDHRDGRNAGIDGFLRPDLRRHIASDDLAAAPAWVKATYDGLLELAVRGDDAAAMAALDAVGTALNEAASLFSGAVAPGDEAVRQIIAMRRTLAAREARIARLEARLGEIEGSLWWRATGPFRRRRAGSRSR